MKLNASICCFGIRLLIGIHFAFAAGRLGAEDFDTTTNTVGRHGQDLETPANQLVTPAGTLV